MELGGLAVAVQGGLLRRWGDLSWHWGGLVIAVLGEVAAIIIAALVVPVVVVNAGGVKNKNKIKAYLFAWACLHGYVEAGEGWSSTWARHWKGGGGGAPMTLRVVLVLVNIDAAGVKNNKIKYLLAYFLGVLASRPGVCHHCQRGAGHWRRHHQCCSW